MSKINTLPKGLQEFLGNTSQGQNPSELNQEVRPIIDLFSFWAVDKTKHTTKTQAITQSGIQIFLGPVPVGETWVPLHMGAILTGIEEGDDIRMRLGAFQRAALSELVLKTGDTYSNPALGPTTSNQYSVGYTWPRVEMYPAGASFAMTAEHVNFTQPSENITVSLTYVQLRS